MPSTNIKITATDKTQRAFQSAQRSVGGLKKSIIGLKGAVGMMFGAVAIGKLVGFSSQLMDTADSIAKVSTRLQISSKELQGLSFASELAGSSVESLHNNMTKFVYNIGQARIGTKAMKDEFKELGVNLKNKNGTWKDHATVFREVADAYGRTNDATRIVTSSMILFGRGGKQMVNMMMNGSEGIDRFTNLLKKSGGVMKDEFLDASENIHDSMTLWGKIMDSNTARVLTPFIEKVLELSDAMFEAKGINPNQISSMKKLVRNYNDLEVEIRKYQETLKEGETIWMQLGIGSMEETQQELTDAKKKQDAIAMQMLKLSKLAEKKKAISNVVVDEGKKEVEQINAISQAEQKMYSSSITMAFDAHAKKSAKTIEQTAKQKELRDQIIEFRRTEEQQITFDIMEEHARRMEIIKAFYGEEVETSAEANRVIARQKADTAEKLIAIDQEKKDSAIDTSKAMIASMGSANKSWFQANKALAISDTIMSTYNAATKALTIPPPWVGMAYSATIYGLGMANVNRIRNEKYEPRAMGGSVNAGQSYIVGERGKELFTPNQSGNITPNDKMGGTTNINFKIDAVDAEGVDELLEERRGFIMSLVDQALHENGRGRFLTTTYHFA